MEAGKVLEVLYTFPVEGILNKLASLAAQEISLFRGFKKELTKLRQSLLAIQDFLGDVAHQPQQRGKAVEDWVRKLRDIADDADNVLDEINYEDLRRQVEQPNQKREKVRKFISSSNPYLFRRNMAHKIKSINASLLDLQFEASFIGLVSKKIDATPPEIVGARETDSIFEEDEIVVGRKEDLSKIITILTNSNLDQENLSVMPIVGMGGLGKTTLANAHGCVVIVTTRIASVASIMKKVLPMYVLGSLSVDDCWDILKKRAFPDGNAPIAKDLETIGKEIARKCAGIPLTAKVLGSMMRSKDSIDDWLEIQKSKIWELPEGDERIMSVLKLSFDHLKSPSLKLCFAYCSKFKKDFEMERADLIQLWMAQGFLCFSQNKDMEDIGDEYFTILLQNSLFQDVIRDDFGTIIYCKMHDLVHDLAELVSRSEIEDKLENQHVAWNPFKSSERNVEKRRSLFVNGDQALIINTLLTSFKALRVLNLYRADIKELPSSIGVLIHLRYLNVSGTKIKQLPKSIGKLYNLQTLRMEDTWNLVTFPKEMENLINLRHVYFDYDMLVPFGMGRLKHLQTISPWFTLDEERNHEIDELGGLNQLKGELIIRGLEHVRDRGQAGASNLVGKANLRRLTLEWSSSLRGRNEKDIDVLEGLRPNSELEILKIDKFMGSKLASWMMSGSLPLNLTEIRLENCKECEQVPSLGHLPNLRLVHLESMRKLKCVGVEFYGYNHDNGAATSTKKKETLFPALKSLTIYYCPSLIKWEELPTDEKVAVFPCLEDLIIRGCPSLEFIPITLAKGMPCLRKLKILFCQKLSRLPISLEYCISLQKLKIIGCDGLTRLPSGLPSCTSLKKLRIESCHNLISLADLDVSRLSIRGCSNLTSIPLSQSDSDAPTLPLLEDLTIRSCSSLEFIPITLGMTCLRNLEIKDCENLSSLPTRLEYCISLEQLSIRRCPKLTSRLSLVGCTSLRDLRIEECNELTSIMSGLQSCTSPSSLYISDCQNLRHLPADGRQTLVSLYQLTIARCPNLEAIPNLDNLTSLDNLNIRGCNGLTSLPSGLPSCKSLKELTIDYCRSLKYLRMEGLRSLTSLVYMRMGAFSEELDSFPDFELPSQIQTLEIVGWPKLKSLPQQQIQHCTCLEVLFIESFDSVEALPEWLGNLTSLNTLSISLCKNLVSLPAVEVMQCLTKLQKLVIEACPRLGGRSALKSGPEWHKISHIPHINDANDRNLLVMRIRPRQPLHKLASTVGAESEGCPSDGFAKLINHDVLWQAQTDKDEIWWFKACENLVYLPAIEVMQHLTKLVACPGLGGRSALLSGPEWHKISHIPYANLCSFLMHFSLMLLHECFDQHSFCICFNQWRVRGALAGEIAACSDSKVQIFGTSIHLKLKESLEVVYKNVMIWRIYSSDEGTLQMNYLLVMDSCMDAYHREQRPLFLVLFDSMSFTYAIARLSNNEEKRFPSTSKRNTSRREYFSWLVELCVLSLRRKKVEVLL
ncbi:unnamed protein product [Prunus armeniaca]